MSRLDAALRRAGALPDAPAPDLPRLVPRRDERNPIEAAPSAAVVPVAPPVPAAASVPPIAAPAIAAPPRSAPMLPRKTVAAAKPAAAAVAELDEYNDGRSYVDEKLVTMRNITQSTVEQ